MTEPRELTLEEVYGIEQRRVGFITDSDIVDLVSTIIALHQRLEQLTQEAESDQQLFEAIYTALDGLPLKEQVPGRRHPRYVSAPEQITQLRQRLEQAERSNAKEEDHRLCNKAIAEWAKKTSNLEAKLATVERERDDAVDKREGAYMRLDGLQSQLTTAQATIQALTARVAELEERIRIANESATY